MIALYDTTNRKSLKEVARWLDENADSVLTQVLPPRTLPTSSF